MLESINTIEQKIEKLKDIFREFFISKGFQPDDRDGKICVSQDGKDLGCVFNSPKRGKVKINVGEDFSYDLESRISDEGFETELDGSGFWVDLE